MKELRRNYNTTFFDGQELSHIVLTDGKDFIHIQSTNLYFKEVPIYGDQDYETQLDNIKKGNKLLFKDGIDTKTLPLNRLLSPQSIPYDVRLNLLNSSYDSREGNWLFLEVNFDEMTTEFKHYTSSETSSGEYQYYTFPNLPDLIFTKVVWWSDKNQCIQRLYENLRPKMELKNYYPLEKGAFTTQRVKLLAEVELYDEILLNHDKIKVTVETKLNHMDDKVFVGKVNLVGDVLFERTLGHRKEDCQDFFEIYDWETLKKDNEKPQIISKWGVYGAV